MTRILFYRNIYLLLLMITISIMLVACQGSSAYRTYEGAAKSIDTVSRIVVPEKFNILYVDGQEFRGSLLMVGVTLELVPGKHQLVLEYDELWDISSDDHERITSQPVLFEFKTGPGKTYLLNSTALGDIETARRYARKPRVELVEQISKQKIPVVSKYRLKNKKFMAGFSTDAADKSQQDQASQQLEYWWNQSNFKQQQHFLNWVKTHSKKADD